MLVTVFHNPWFVVLRFAIGDVARLDDRGPCPCGRRAGLTLAAIEGRVSGLTRDAAGNAVSEDDLDAVLAPIRGLTAWQLDLPAPARLRLRIMAEPGLARQASRQAREVLRGIYGGAPGIEVASAKMLQHENSGKFRFVRPAFAVDPATLGSEEK